MDGVTIYCGDCMDYLEEIDPMFVLVTDPPYGMRLGKHRGAKDRRSRELRRGGYASYDDTPENYRDVVVPALCKYIDKSVRGAVFALAPSAWMLPAPNALGSVYIPGATGRSPWGFQNTAPILFYGTAPDLNLGAKNTAFVARGVSDMGSGHPCPKPQKWMDWLVALATKQGDVVVDPFCGSGTTLRAAKDARLRTIGVEIEERYCEIAAKKMSQKVMSYE